MTNVRYIKLLEETFETRIRNKYCALWDYMDYIIDEGAKSIGMDCSGEWYYPAIEDFCKYYNILEIPPLYKYIFSGREGFLNQSKSVAYMKTEWNERFPEKHHESPNNNTEIILEYKKYLENLNNEVYNKNYNLEHLNYYLGLIEYSDSEIE